MTTLLFLRYYARTLHAITNKPARRIFSGFEKFSHSRHPPATFGLMIQIRHCHSDSDYSFARQLVDDYIRWLDMDLSFQDIGKELSDLPAMYGPPSGLFLLAWEGDGLAGGVALRMLEPSVCEMKRLFVYDRCKGRGIGRMLCAELIRAAKEMGYERMRLDTLGRMEAAIGLYRSLGFYEIDPYRYNPDETARYMELELG